MVDIVTLGQVFLSSQLPFHSCPYFSVVTLVRYWAQVAIPRGLVSPNPINYISLHPSHLHLPTSFPLQVLRIETAVLVIFMRLMCTINKNTYCFCWQQFLSLDFAKNLNKVSSVYLMLHVQG